MEHPRLARLAAACIALAAGVAGAQSITRTTPSNAPAAQAGNVTGMAGAGTTAGGAATGSGNVPLGTGTDGRAVIIVTPPAANGTNAMGAGAAAPRGPLTAVDIAAMFLSADTNRDGELSRAEAQRARLPISFDDLDANHDGILSRSEFDEAFR